MCGVAGIFHRDSAGAVDLTLLRRMTSALRHRGPDGDGFHVEPGIGLGHRRLAIIDVEGGHQPMFNEDDTVVIVFNGEIYNFGELREELQALGHVFRNRCDTEAIIHAWESWGPDCLQRLNGMFAFALWDRNRGQLFVARDRLGKKPLYYASMADGSLAFASEMAALATIPGLQRRIDATAVDGYFTFGYVPDPQTLYHGIHKLPAAHFMLLDRTGKVPVPRRYWTVPTATRPLAEMEAVTRLNALLADCVEQRLVADVPLGAFLSGGVDSSAVVATAASRQAAPLTTFTIGFEGEEDETPFAAEIARRYGTVQHNERAAATDLIDAARVQGRIFGEPFGDSSSVPSFAVCALARRHATVAISGDGGDEVFAGYRRYRWHTITDAVRRHVPAPLRRHVIGGLAALYPKLDRAPRWLRARHTLSEISLDSACGYARMLTRVQSDRRRALFSARLRVELDGYDPAARIARLMEESDTEDALLQAQYVDLHTWLVGDILTKVDRTSMANSLEVRTPFLDYRMVEWGMSLPASLKLQAGEGKYVLKRALEPLLPRAILYRRKQGFATALALPLRQGIGRVRKRLLGEAMLSSGLFEAGALARLIDEHASGRFDHGQALWQLLVFEGFLADSEAAPDRPARVAALA
jgi:asparagine synthase (glutamine-hydrolysing)